MRFVPLFGFVLLGLSRTAAAQEAAPPPLSPGAKVRVTLASERVIGTLRSLEGDSIVVAKGAVLRRWPKASVEGIEIGTRRSRTGWTLAGLGIGLGTGALLGAATLSAVDDGDDILGPEFPAVAGAVMGGFLGGITGMIVGYNRPPWRWTETTLPRVGLVPARVGIAMSIAF